MVTLHIPHIILKYFNIQLLRLTIINLIVNEKYFLKHHLFFGQQWINTNKIFWTQDISNSPKQEKKNIPL